MLENIGLIIAFALILFILVMLGLMIRRVRLYSKAVKDMRLAANKVIENPNSEDLKSFMELVEYVPIPNHHTMWDLMREVLSATFACNDIPKQHKNKLKRLLEKKGVNLNEIS